MTASVTRRLVIACAVVFLLQSFDGDRMLATFALWPIGRFHVRELHAVVGFRPWQLVTSAFLHANLLHLALNMFALRIFGRDVELALGGARYLRLYATAVVTAALTQLVVVSSAAEVAPYPTVGASGGIFGVLLAFGVLFPRRVVQLLFPPIPMRAWVFVTIYGLIELGSGVFGTDAGVAHFAHLGGMLGAWLTLQRWRRDQRHAAS